MSLSNTFSLGADTLVLGQGDEDVNIVSQNGQDIKINGIVPSAGGGGGVPPVGDIDFIGNLNCNDLVGGGAKGIITAEKKVVSGLDGIFSSGEIKTGAANDIHAGKDLVFDGQDVYKSYPGVVPVIPNKTYKEYKNLIAPTDNTTFTGTIKYRDNAVSIQALNDDVPAVYEDTITLNTNGNIQCDTINNVSEITTGTVVCDNGALNECKARVFNTRTRGTNGWNIKQALEEANPPGNQANNILQIAATQAQAAGIPVEVYITSSEFDPSNNDNPNIKLIPDTVLNGGTIQAAQFELGTATNRFYLKQDIGGPNNQVLQIRAPTTNATVNFKDSVNADVLVVKGTAVELANTIPLNFGSYSFTPIEITHAFTGAVVSDVPGTLFNSLTTNFTRTNDGATVVLNDLGEGVYILSIDATSSSGGLVGSSRFMCNFPYMVSANAAGEFVFEGNYCMNTTPPGPPTYPTFLNPKLQGDGTSGPIGSTNYSFEFPSVAGGTETYDGTVKITRLSY